jgi:hypothetical protein
MWPACERARSGRQQAGHERRFIEPRRKDAVEDDALEVRLFDPYALEVRLMIEATGGVVVSRGIAGSDVERRSRDERKENN